MSLILDKVNLAQNSDPGSIAEDIISSQPALKGYNVSSLYFVITELLSNAIDHGLLQLDSAMKNSTDGFDAFYAMRTQRIADLEDGQIKIEIESKVISTQLAEVTLSISHTGKGVEVAPSRDSAGSEHKLYGRGTQLIKALTKDYRYSNAGKTANATLELVHE